jgi:hypothetical protein
VRKYRDEGIAEEAVVFGPSPDNVLLYRLVQSDAADSVAASFTNNELTVLVPTAEARRWTESDEVGIEAVQHVDGAGEIHILIEKDFACLTARPGDNDHNFFPNPAAETTC